MSAVSSTSWAYRRLDRRVGLRRIPLCLTNGVDPVEGLGIVSLAQEHQVVVVAEDIPNLIDPAAHQLNLVLNWITAYTSE